MTRIDHAQLLASMVVDCISIHMRNNVDLCIQAVRIFVVERYNSHIPAYKKLWRNGSWQLPANLVVGRGHTCL